MLTCRAREAHPTAGWEGPERPGQPAHPWRRGRRGDRRPDGRRRSRRRGPWPRQRPWRWRRRPRRLPPGQRKRRLSAPLTPASPLAEPSTDGAAGTAGTAGSAGSSGVAGTEGVAGTAGVAGDTSACWVSETWAALARPMPEKPPTTRIAAPTAILVVLLTLFIRNVHPLFLCEGRLRPVGAVNSPRLQWKAGQRPMGADAGLHLQWKAGRSPGGGPSSGGAYKGVIARAPRKVTHRAEVSLFFLGGHSLDPNRHNDDGGGPPLQVTRRRRALLGGASVSQSLIRSLITMVWSRSGPTPIAEKRVPDSFSSAST